MRADRLLSLMLLLQANGRMTAIELSERLGVSERTIYRDLDALSTAGVPVYTQSGTNGGCFLDENYRISLTGLSRQQIRALMVSTDLAGPLSDLGLTGEVEASLLKLLAALPPVHRSEAERMRKRFFVDPTGWFFAQKHLTCLPIIEEAVWEDREVQMLYAKPMSEPAERTLHPYGLVCKASVWYVVGAYPDGQLRNLRVDRIVSLHLTGNQFKRPAEFDLHAYWQQTQERFRTEAPVYPVILQLTHHAHQKLKLQMDGRFRVLETDPFSQKVTVEIIFAVLDEARMVTMGLGDEALVIEPGELREAIMEQIARIADLYQTETYAIHEGENA